MSDLVATAITLLIVVVLGAWKVIDLIRENTNAALDQTEVEYIKELNRMERTLNIELAQVTAWIDAENNRQQSITYGIDDDGNRAYFSEPLESEQ